MESLENVLSKPRNLSPASYKELNFALFMSGDYKAPQYLSVLSWKIIFLPMKKSF